MATMAKTAGAEKLFCSKHTTQENDDDSSVATARISNKTTASVANRAYTRVPQPVGDCAANIRWVMQHVGPRDRDKIGDFLVIVSRASGYQGAFPNTLSPFIQLLKACHNEYSENPNLPIQGDAPTVGTAVSSIIETFNEDQIAFINQEWSDRVREIENALSGFNAHYLRMLDGAVQSYQEETPAESVDDRSEPSALSCEVKMFNPNTLRAFTWTAIVIAGVFVAVWFQNVGMGLYL